MDNNGEPFELLVDKGAFTLRDELGIMFCDITRMDSRINDLTALRRAKRMAQTPKCFSLLKRLLEALSAPDEDLSSLEMLGNILAFEHEIKELLVTDTLTKYDGFMVQNCPRDKAAV